MRTSSGCGCSLGATAVVDHRDVPVERPRLHGERVHRRRPTDRPRAAARAGTARGRSPSPPRSRTPSATVIVPRRLVRGELVGRARGTAAAAAPSPSDAERLAHDRRLGARATEPAVHGAVAEDDRPSTRRAPSSAPAATPRSRARTARRARVSSHRLREHVGVHQRGDAASARTGSPTTRGRAAAACRCCARRGARPRRSPR